MTIFFFFPFLVIGFVALILRQMGYVSASIVSLEPIVRHRNAQLRKSIAIEMESYDKYGLPIRERVIVKPNCASLCLALLSSRSSVGLTDCCVQRPKRSSRSRQSRRRRR